MSDSTLVYDDDCGFCTWWAYRIADRSEVDLVGFSELTDDLRERLPDDYEDCAHLVTDDEVYSCGESIEEAFLHSGVGGDVRPVVEFLRQFDEYGGLRERAYRLVADNRDTLGHVVSVDPPARSGGSD
ncbi:MULTISPECIES: DCC1-like thiol-disulfide oxidoreductase family protein [Salinibaculum]|uniref:DCC1-like thiol-disulfide oxidoreductase family protein n=1 Tax=Salinibaculum TaxID=2732368 RepID=UPI0030CBC9F6